MTTCIMGQVGASEVSTAAAERRATADVWLDDLRWHKKMYRGARFRWTGEHVMNVLTRYTGGQLSFTTVAHLEQLQGYQSELLAYSSQVRDAMAVPLRAALKIMGPHWEPIADPLGLTVVDCKAAVWCAKWSAPPTRRNVNIERVLRRLPFANPLIETWELKQLWRLYETAADVFEDTIVDLVDELRPHRPIEALVAATDTRCARGLQTRVDAAREQRGRPGDSRRSLEQTF